MNAGRVHARHRTRQQVLATALTLLALVAAGSDDVPATYVAIPAGRFISALAVDGSAAQVPLARFAIRVEPVTNGEFLRFVQGHPDWQRGQVSPLFAGPGYLKTWQTPLNAGAAVDPTAPVTEVSWFAARAFCASEQARLPTWYEWEYVAAADATRLDARADPLRNQAILSAILASSGTHPGAIGREPANRFGVQDLNRLLWEWTSDIAAMFPNADSRVSGAGANLALCGGSALAFADKNQYALMMRVAALAALNPADDASRVGFRCARDLPGN